MMKKLEAITKKVKLKQKQLGRGIFFLGDALLLLKSLEEESIDHIFCDPPYRITQGGQYKEHKADGSPRLTKAGWGNSIFKQNNGKAGFHHNDLEPRHYMHLLYRVLKPGGHCYVMMNHIHLEALLTAARKAGFIFSNILAWEKNNAVMNQRYMKHLEYVFLFYKRPAIAIRRRGSKQKFFEINPPGKHRVHPTQKPVKLIKHYIKNSSRRGNIVLDPFAGSGSTAIAAQKLGRRWITCEIDPHYANKAVHHIRTSCKLAT